MAGNTSNLTFRLFGKDVSASKAFRGVGKSASDVGSKLSGAGLLLAGVGIAAAVAGTAVAIDFAKTSVDAASNMNETLSKTTVLFGKQSESVVKWADTTAASLGISSQSALDAAGTFAIFGKGAGLSGKSLEKFAEQNATLAGDMASFFNTSPEDAITAIGAAFRGEMEPIRKYGVLLDDASLRNQALKMGLIKTTKQALTPQQKVLAAQALIMKQTTSAQGDFARTSGGLANQQRILSAEFANVSTKVGQALIPLLTKLAVFATTTLIPAIQQIASWIGEHLGPVFASLGEWITTVALPAIQNLAAAFMENVWPAIQQVAAMIAENLQPVVESLADFWTNTLLPGIQDLIPIVQKVATVIGVVVGALLVAITFIVGKVAPVFFNILGGAVRFIIALLGKIIEWIQKVVGWFVALVGFIGGLGGKIASAASGMWDGLKTGLGAVVNWIIDRINNILDTIRQSIDGFNSLPGPDIPFSVPHLSHVALAKGGIVTRPTLALIGEAGPEAVIPLSGRNRPGGVTINITQPLGTPQQIGRVVLDAMRQAQGSGRAVINF